ncbi:helix-turn-helix domain-containing protein [Thaumasiovibrio subtropicus]|uniref:helix-turn-helix domain-containing protein n=1 Tax=Thaumasiovibrio subtropicus TaxID=1891207 RepID=UPI000B36420E|nr:AraC family transcriptional regulator [Thaumasiovibrio subtropicus]
MTKKSWQTEQQSFEDRLSRSQCANATAIADPNGRCFIAQADFAAAASVFEPAPFLMINLCIAHRGNFRRRGDGPSLEGVMKPGTVALSLPNTAAEGFWPKTQQLGIAINPETLPEQYAAMLHEEKWVPAASTLHNDTLLSSVMMAMWRDAEVNGLSSAFFEHGVYLLLNHLAAYQSIAHQKPVTYALSGPRLTSVLALIDSRLTDNVSVSELAQEAGLDVRSFSRSFYAAMGQAPYAYFTYRRMELAKQLLAKGQLTITEIAQTVGYANPSKFSAAFKRVYAITPRQWRKMR